MNVLFFSMVVCLVYPAVLNVGRVSKKWWVLFYSVILTCLSTFPDAHQFVSGMVLSGVALLLIRHLFTDKQNPLCIRKYPSLVFTKSVDSNFRAF